MGFSERVDEDRLAQILLLIADPPNRRSAPAYGDLEGEFDFWFDGGACKGHTGTKHYSFSDGTVAIVVCPAPWLQVVVEFPSGHQVQINQMRELSQTPDIACQFKRPAEWYCIFCGSVALRNLKRRWFRSN